MRRILPVLILLLAPAAADERKSYTDARFELEKANFDELPPTSATASSRPTAAMTTTR